MALSRGLKLLFLLLVGVTVVTSRADVRREDNYVWRRARTIDSGQRVFSLQTSYQSFSNFYADDGRVHPLGAPYTRPLTWDRLLAFDTVSKADIQEYMRKNNLRGSDIAAITNYQVDRKEVGFGLNWAYGLTKQWMVGLLAPVRFVTTQVHQAIQYSGSLSPALRRRLKQLSDADLSASGYDEVPATKQSWEFGDVTLLNQVEMARAYKWTWALQQQVQFPTARSQSISEYISSQEDAGSMNLGLTSLTDYQWRRGVAGFRVGYVAQLPDTVRMHAPASNTGSVDPRVNRDLGDWMWAALDGEVRVSRKVGFSAEHSFLAKGRDRYSGDTFTSTAYDQMANHSDQQLQQTRLGVLYKIGGTNSRVNDRWMASVDYTYPWIGKNSSDAAQASFELINYF